MTDEYRKSRKHGFPNSTYERRLEPHRAPWPERWEDLTGVVPNVERRQNTSNGKYHYKFVEGKRDE